MPPGRDRPGGAAAGGLFLKAPAGFPLKFHVLVDHLAIVGHFDKHGIGDLFSLVVKPRGAENHIVTLPLPRRQRRVDIRRVPFDIFAINPARIQAAAFNARIGVLFHAKAVVYL